MTQTDDPARRLILSRRTVEMFGLPGDRCADAACRRRGRCHSATPEGPACLRHLDAAHCNLYRRLLVLACWGDANPIRMMATFYGSRRDPVMLLAAEIIRRAQPRGHDLHAALASSSRDCHGTPFHAKLSLSAALAAPPRLYEMKPDRGSASA